MRREAVTSGGGFREWMRNSGYVIIGGISCSAVGEEAGEGEAFLGCEMEAFEGSSGPASFSALVPALSEGTSSNLEISSCVRPLLSRKEIFLSLGAFFMPSSWRNLDACCKRVSREGGA